jgi:penicillin V acylase-like amidase (Ntn superfamily)
MANTQKSQPSNPTHALGANKNWQSDSTYAFPKQQKEPLNDASHVRNALARFDQVKDVSDEDREEAFHHIKAAAKKFGVEVTETHWKQLGSKPHTTNTADKKAG